MATYWINVYAADPDHLVNVLKVVSERGNDAVWAAHVDIHHRHADHADVFMADGTGSAWFYAAVRNEIEEFSDGTRLYRDDVQRVLMEARNSRPSPGRPLGLDRLGARLTGGEANR